MCAPGSLGNLKWKLAQGVILTVWRMHSASAPLIILSSAALSRVITCQIDYGEHALNPRGLPNHKLEVDKCFEWLHHKVKACFQLLVVCMAYLPQGADQPGCAPISKAGSLIFIIIFMQAANLFAFQLKSESEHYTVFSSDMVEFWICMHWGVEALPITDQGCKVKKL